MEALGLVETKGFLSAVVAADVAVKSANVTLLNAEKIRGGYVTMQITGDVGAVRAAVDAATEAITPFGTLISSHVIPRMHSEITWLVTPEKESEEVELVVDEAEATPEEEQEEQEEIEPEPKQETEEEPEPEKNATVDASSDAPLEEEQDAQEDTSFKRTDLEDMTVAELRKLVRKEDTMKEDRSQIKYATKSTLIDSLLNQNKVR